MVANFEAKAAGQDIPIDVVFIDADKANYDGYYERSFALLRQGGLIGVANGVLVYLFFDLMHEATEQTGARDVMSWVVFLGSLGVSFVGLVALTALAGGVAWLVVLIG